MELNTLTAECPGDIFKVMPEEKETNSWLKSSGLTRICYETKALDGYKEELMPIFKSTPTQSQAIIYAAVYTQNVGDFVGEPTHHRARPFSVAEDWRFEAQRQRQ